MDQKTLTADAREERKSAASRRLRRAGKIPAIIYGHQEPVAITLDAKEFRTQFRVVSESQIIRLSVGKKDYDVLIKDYQEDILTGDIEHIDFYEIEKGKALRTNIAVHIEGSAIGSREGGVLEHLMHSVEVECLPKDIPHHILVNVEALEIGHSLHISDLDVPEGVRILNNPEQTVVLVAASRAEAELEALEAEAEEALEGEEGEEAAAEGAEEAEGEEDSEEE
jgi:large subunit ribosomal protein L25